ncbi:MAG: rhomboid family intramembrane serine protease [Proteobacteria bacterium]|nr:rhomboid family intramembrane serine protease [Pseudomonadota bacterium]
MIPIKDNIPSKRVPYINYLLIFINILVFALELKAGNRIDDMIKNYAFHANELYHLFLGINDSFDPIKKIFTSMFMHGGFSHIFGNMLYLYIFGDNVEDRLGHFMYLFLYLTFGVFALLLQFFFNPLSNLPMLGASGAVSGVMGAYFIFYPRARVITLVPIFIFIQFIEVPAFFFLFFWFILQFLYGTLSIYGGSMGVAWWAHIGGFVAGFLFAILHKIFFRGQR